MAKKTDNFNFEHALKELEQLVERMEKGELGLEESLKSFARGVQLTHACQEALKTAEQKIEILLAQDPSTPPVPFEPDD